MSSKVDSGNGKQRQIIKKKHFSFNLASSDYTTSLLTFLPSSPEWSRWDGLLSVLSPYQLLSASPFSQFSPASAWVLPQTEVHCRPIRNSLSLPSGCSSFLQRPPLQHPCKQNFDMYNTTVTKWSGEIPLQCLNKDPLHSF